MLDVLLDYACRLTADAYADCSIFQWA